MPSASYIRTNAFIRYDGTNGPEIAAIMGRTILSDTGTVLTFVPSPPITFTDVFQLGDAFSPRAGFFLKADFEAQYVTAASMTPQPDQVGTVDGVSVAVPILLLGGFVDRDIVWTRPFPSADYALSFLTDANTLGKITVVEQSTPAKTKNGVRVRISAALALTVAGVVHVIGTTKANPAAAKA